MLGRSNVGISPISYSDHSIAAAFGREASRLLRVSARAATLTRHVWRSWLAVGLGGMLVGCAAPSRSEDEPTADTASELTGDPTIDGLVNKMRTCHVASRSKFATDAGGASKIDVCKLKGAFFFKADMDIDCDGKKTSACNSSTDSSWQNQTAATDSHGKPLVAAAVPYVVVPGVSSRWSFDSAGIGLGTVAAVIYDGKLTFGVVGDIGPKAIIGEASYAMADSLGIDPNPSTGGVDSGVSYILFTGSDAVLKRNEDHAEAVTLGMERANVVLAEN